jgi:rhodanese-related sulfurtransferase
MTTWMSARPFPFILHVSATLAFCLTLLLSVGCEKNITDSDIEPAGYAEVQGLIEDAREKKNPDLVLLIDPRSPAEFARGYIPGARNIQIDEFPSNLNESRQGRIPAYEKYEYIVVYGNDPASGSAKAMVKRLLANEYDSVFWFRGGILEWVKSGNKLEFPPAP